MDSWGAYLTLGVAYLGTLLLIRWVVLTRKRQPIATVAWILAIILLPIAGAVLFLFFGVNQVERRKERMQEAQRSASERLPDLDIDADPTHQQLSDTQQRLLRLASASCGTQLTADNRIELLIDTNIAMRRIEEAILAAKESIHLEYYIWKPDRIGLRIRDLLIERAGAGVTVRFLYDSLGSFSLSRRFLKPLREAGIQFKPFLPGQTLREQWSINLRTHRKIVVTDGRVGFTGGMNIGDEYLGRNRDLGYWRDTHMRLTGPTVLQLQHVFAEDWFYATGEELREPHHYPDPEPQDGVAAQVVSGGPVGEVRTFHSLMFAAINEARRQITLATSFFVPTEALVMALETAALRGVDVRLLVAGRSEHPWTVYAGRSYYETLLRAGVTIHEYRRGILHSKTLTVDGCWSLVGSPNFDARSLLLNFEVGVAVYDEHFARQLEEHYESDLEHARLIRHEDWSRRRVRQILIENFCRLFSPVL